MANEITEAPDPGSQQVGARMRHFRKQEDLTLRELASRSGLSIGFLSQVERGISQIGLTALGSVANALNRSIADFFNGDSEPAPSAPFSQPPTTPASTPQNYFSLSRAEQPGVEYISGQQTYRLLSSRGRNLVLEPMIVYIAPGGHREVAYGHPGEEFAYVLEGQLLYEVDGVEHRLHPGDSLHLLSHTPHRMYNDTDQVTSVVSVVTPRLF